MIDLFNTNTVSNLLPYDGEANYHGPILSPVQAGMFMESLLHNIEWKNNEAIIFGQAFYYQTHGCMVR